jgi:hypothetical protein
MVTSSVALQPATVPFVYGRRDEKASLIGPRALPGQLVEELVGFLTRPELGKSDCAVIVAIGFEQNEAAGFTDDDVGELPLRWVH